MAVTSRSLRSTAVVETPEQVELNLVLAGVGSRFVALAVDMLCQFLIIVAFLFLFWGPVTRVFEGHFSKPKGFDGQAEWMTLLMAAASLVAFGVNFFYFAAFEMLWRGQTPGKRYMGLRVVRDGGYPLDARSAILRNLLRAADMVPANYLLGAIVLFAGSAGKRIGDYVAGTVVILEKTADDEAELDLTPAQSSKTSRLTDTQQNLLSEFLRRRMGMDPEARERLAATIAAQLAAHLGTSVGNDAEAFLEGCAHGGD